MPRYRTGRNNRSDKCTITPDEVFDAICTLAEALSTLPTQRMIAEHLDCTQQHVSAKMKELADPVDGRITWLTKNVYFVDQSRWERLEMADHSPA
jgi:predicted transcriptional regulator